MWKEAADILSGRLYLLYGTRGGEEVRGGCNVLHFFDHHLPGWYLLSIYKYKCFLKKKKKEEEVG